MQTKLFFKNLYKSCKGQSLYKSLFVLQPLIIYEMTAI